MFNDTITVFNEHNGKWYKHIIPGVDFGVTNGAGNTTLNGTTRADTATILIQCSADKEIFEADTISLYKPPKEYAALDDPEGYITFGLKNDFIIQGVYEDNAEIIEDDYEAGFYDYMNSKYDNVYLISNAAFFSLIPHFEIGAR